VFVKVFARGGCYGIPKSDWLKGRRVVGRKEGAGSMYSLSHSHLCGVVERKEGGWKDGGLLKGRKVLGACILRATATYAGWLKGRRVVERKEGG
jgi:hypothetical protein